MKMNGPRKRAKVNDPVHAHFYPPFNADDDVSLEHNLSLLKEESEKGKPQSDVLKELMRRTFRISGMRTLQRMSHQHCWISETISSPS